MTDLEDRQTDYEWKRTIVAFQMMFLGLFVAMFGTMMQATIDESVGWRVTQAGVAILVLGSIPWTYYDIIRPGVRWWKNHV